MTETTETSKLAHLKKYDVALLFDNTTRDTIRGEDGQLPADTHIVTYEDDGQVKLDAARACKMADIFDGYHDRGLKVTRIESGFGKLRPNLYNVNKDEKKEKKK